MAQTIFKQQGSATRQRNKASVKETEDQVVVVPRYWPFASRTVCVAVSRLEAGRERLSRQGPFSKDGGVNGSTRLVYNM